jgi:hypothetical protein
MITVECAGCHRRIVISQRWAGKKMKCNCGAYIQIEELEPPPKSTAIGTLASGKTKTQQAKPSVFDELTPLDWTPKQKEIDDKIAFEAREEKVLMSFILKDKERKNPAVAFGLMVLLAIVNFSFAVTYWVLAWMIHTSPDFVERVTTSYPVVDPANLVRVFIVSGIVSMLTAVFVLLPFSIFWWIVSFIFTISTAIRIFEIGNFFVRSDFQENLPKPPIVTLAIVAFMAGYFFSQDARDYFRMRLHVALALLICVSMAVFVLLVLVLRVMMAMPPAE